MQYWSAVIYNPEVVVKLPSIQNYLTGTVASKSTSLFHVLSTNTGTSGPIPALAAQTGQEHATIACSVTVMSGHDKGHESAY